MPLTASPPLPDGIALRAARLADAEALVALHARAIRVSAAAYYSEDEIDAWAGRMTVATCRDAMHSRSMLVAITRDTPPRIVGFGQLHPQEGVIEAIYVEPDCEMRGIGRALVFELEAVARKFGVEWLVADTSLNAVPFCRALGFRQAALDHHEPAPGVHLACVVMEKALASGGNAPSPPRS
jgi:ribosomal protein S18 acetylase RimI-like enzyme